MKKTYRKLKLNCLVILGGNGTQKTANLLREEGLNVIHLPKTIDNDIYGTDVTFGFQSAINVACNAIDCIHTTAASHNRVFIVEVMGHKVGWLTLYAGVASGADIILLPEIPYDINKVVEAIEKRNKQGKGFTILAVAEGAISKEDAKLSKKELKKKRENSKHPTVSYELAEEITRLTGSEARVTVPGHTQRGGSPALRPGALYQTGRGGGHGHHGQGLWQHDCHEKRRDGESSSGGSGRQAEDGGSELSDDQGSQAHGHQLRRLETEGVKRCPIRHFTENPPQRV